MLAVRSSFAIYRKCPVRKWELQRRVLTHWLVWRIVHSLQCREQFFQEPLLAESRSGRTDSVRTNKLLTKEFRWRQYFSSYLLTHGWIIFLKGLFLMCFRAVIPSPQHYIITVYWIIPLCEEVSYILWQGTFMKPNFCRQ